VPLLSVLSYYRTVVIVPAFIVVPLLLFVCGCACIVVHDSHPVIFVPLFGAAAILRAVIFRVVIICTDTFRAFMVVPLLSCVYCRAFIF